MIKNIKITCHDKRELSATLYEPSHKVLNKESFIVFNSALGVKKEFYKDFVEFLALKGYRVLTWDPRGIGKSTLDGGVKTDPARMRDWGQIDFESVINYVLTENLVKEKDLVVFGHSAGGHLIGLAPSIQKVKKIVLISSGTCTWKLYPLQELPKFLLSWFVLVPILVRFFGYAPGSFGIGHDLPKGVIMDWRNWSIKKDYLFSDDTLGELYYQKVSADIKSIGFLDDTAFSPRSTLVDLLEHFSSAQKELKVYTPQELGVSNIGHFGLFKKRNSICWEIITRQLL